MKLCGVHEWVPLCGYEKMPVCAHARLTVRGYEKS